MRNSFTISDLLGLILLIHLPECDSLKKRTMMKKRDQLNANTICDCGRTMANAYNCTWDLINEVYKIVEMLNGDKAAAKRHYEQLINGELKKDCFNKLNESWECCQVNTWNKLTEEIISDFDKIDQSMENKTGKPFKKYFQEF